MTEILDANLQWESTPEEIVAGLSRAPYEVARQPVFPDDAALVDALRRTQAIEPVATPETILATKGWLGHVAISHNDIVVIQGNCNERVGKQSPRQLAEAMLTRREAIIEALGDEHVLIVERGLGQNTKPRTQAGGYCGDAVNDPGNLTPDPERVVAAAEQAHAVQRELEMLDRRAITAHEALLEPLERSRMVVDTNTDQRFLLSAEVPWIGDRTSDPSGLHVEMMRGIENAIGIKVGDHTTPEDIAAWAEKLNPGQEAGKLLFMVRMSDQHEVAMQDIVCAIAEHAPNSVIVYDIHAATEIVDGQKIRATSRIIEQIQLLARICGECDTVLDGVHLESDTLEDDQMQCVDTLDQTPNTPWSVDPQVSPKQLRHILEICKSCLGRQRVLA